MRRNIRDEVLAKHLVRVRARREDLRRVLSGGRALVVPTLQEKLESQVEYARLGPLEAGLAALVPPRYVAGQRRIPYRFEAAVLERIRNEAATRAVPLLQEELLADEQEIALDRALAVFDHCTAELKRIADDEEAMRQARLLERRMPIRRSGKGVHGFVGVGGWALFIGGWW